MAKGTNQRVLDAIPAEVARKSLWGVMQVWRRTQTEVCSPRTLVSLPPFAAGLAVSLWNIEPVHVVQAIKLGDAAFFVAILLRLEQLDDACKAAGRGIDDRSAIYRAKSVVGGFLKAAERLLREQGGTWPPGGAG